MCVKKRSNLKISLSKICIQKAKKFIIKKDSKDNLKLHFQATECTDLPGNRIINLECLKQHVGEITRHSALCEKARDQALQGLDPICLFSEKRNGLETVIKGKCKGCGRIFIINKSTSIESESGNYSEINVKGVWGSMVTGGGCSDLNELLGTMGIPGMKPSNYARTEEQIGEWWRQVLQEDMRDAGREEKEHAIQVGSFHEGIPSISVVCDGGWCKRSHKHTYNAMAGVGVIFGLHSKKLLHIGIRNKLCYICSAAQSRNESPRAHKCFKNWNDSAQSMESDIVLEGFLNCEKDHGVRYMKVIADGDSSVYSSIVNNVAQWGPSVQKIECANHACKCLRSHLEQLVVDKPYYKGKGGLTMQNRKKIVQGVRCAIRMRSKEKELNAAKRKLTADIKNSARHVLGLHDQCSTRTMKNVSNGTVIDEESLNDEDDNGDAVKDACDMWVDTMMEMSVEDEMKIRKSGTSKESINPDLLKDIFLY